jgi:hypothetical protein
MVIRQKPGMKFLLATVTLTLSLALSSCIIPLPFVGGGVAGGAMDSLRVRKSAENYPEFANPAATVTLLPYLKTAQQNNRSDLFSRFPTRTTVPEKTPTDFAGVSITYRNQQLSIARDNQRLITEEIPSAFYFSGMQVASVRFGGVPCLLVATFSRASTAMVWIGLYHVDGTRLYLATLPRGDIWDVVPSTNGFTLVGTSGSKRIAIKAP